MNTKTSPPLLSEIAYERILDALMAQSLPLGAILTQHELTKIAGVPVGPVRDALKALENDGIVVIHPRSGIEVIRRSTDLIRSTYQFRMLIERDAARVFALQASTAEVRRLIDLHEAADAEYGAADPTTTVSDRMTKLENSFHFAIVAALGNEMINLSYRRLTLMSRIIKLNDFVLPVVARTSVAEHLVVLYAFKNRDADAAEAAIRQHLLRALNRSLGLT